jgi:catechol 2,3-dioxygenase-like lactoylglutathione lyase family enzyme
MIRGVHTMFYTSNPDELRAFLRDKLGFSYSDLGDGWLIFDLPEADMGCHPASAEDGARSGTHSISFYCDDIKKTVAELKARGVEFIDSIADHGYGLVTHFLVPGGFAIQLYQPLYSKRSRRPAAKSTARTKSGGRSAAVQRGRSKSGKRAAPAKRKKASPSARRAKSAKRLVSSSNRRSR